MKSKKTVYELTSMGLMTAIMCVLAPFSIFLPGMVPISLGTLVIYFFPYILGTRRSAVCCLVYIILGAIGLPVFSGFSGGIPKLVGPTGGYLIGYFLIILFEGSAIKRFPTMRLAHILGMIMGTISCYIVGTAWLSFQLKLTFMKGLAAGVIPFIPGDAIKMAIAVMIAPIILNRLKKAKSLPSSEA